MAPTDPLTFLASNASTATDVAAAAQAVVAGTMQVTRRWFDTFDWDLWHAGVVLEADAKASGGYQVVLRGRVDHQPHWTQVTDTIPSSADQLPVGPWRRSLGDLLGIRALVPIAEAEVTSTEITATDKRDKKVAGALIETVAPADSEPTTFVRVVSVRGYDAEAADLATRLGGLEDLRPSKLHPLSAATIGGRTPGTSGTEVRVTLVPDQSAISAIADMLRNFHRVMSTLEPWLVNAPDIEFLHDWRVALRRSRSVLKLARDIIPQRDLEMWRPRLRDLQQRSGELRDLDVFVLEFDSYVDLVPDEFAADLDPLRELLHSRRRAARDEFEHYVSSRDHDRLRADYGAFIDRLAHTEPTEEVIAAAPDAAEPIRSTGVARIRKAHRRVIKRGRKIRPDSPAGDLHDVRIATKELRYAIELHSSILAKKDVKALLKRLKRLQDVLGAFQDAEAHASAMGLFADYLVATGDAPARSIMAIGVLSQAFTDRNAELRDRFDEVFARFDHTKTVNKLDRALRRQNSS